MWGCWGTQVQQSARSRTPRKVEEGAASFRLAPVTSRPWTIGCERGQDSMLSSPLATLGYPCGKRWKIA